MKAPYPWDKNEQVWKNPYILKTAPGYILHMHNDFKPLSNVCDSRSQFMGVWENYWLHIKDSMVLCTELCMFKKCFSPASYFLFSHLVIMEKSGKRATRGQTGKRENDEL